MAAIKRTVPKKLDKRPKVTRLQVDAVERQYIGDEPVVLKSTDLLDMTKSYNWYNYKCDSDDALNFIVAYLEQNDKYSKTDVAQIKRVPKYAVPLTACWAARIATNGNKLPDRSQAYLDSSIAAALAYKTERVAEKASTDNVINIQQRVKNKSANVITTIEEELDSSMSGFDIYSHLTKIEASPAIVAYIRDYYIKQHDEVHSSDEQVKEAFGKSLKLYQTFWSKFIGDLDRFVGNVKATKVRAPRAKKTISAIDLVKEVSYQKLDNGLKLVSINPAEIIGAQQLWTFNTKYRILNRFDADGPGGFYVRGTTMYGFDKEKASAKTLRKPAETLQKVLSANKVGLRKLMDEIKTTESKPSGRINNDIILLRVVK